MSDRKLLEMAAKAAGFNLEWQDNKPHIGDWLRREWWNPLTDDGDALRLAVKLNIGISRSDKRFEKVRTAFISDFELFSSTDEDVYAATRFAIVRAAAEIGKNLK